MTQQPHTPAASQPADHAAAASPALGRAGLLAAVGLPLIVYLATVSPTVMDGDSASLSLQAYSLGLAHAPGYAVNALMGKALTTCLPVGTHAWRANLLAALAALVVVLVGYVLLRRWRVPAVPAVAAVWVLAFSPLFWSQALHLNGYIVSLAWAFTTLLALEKWAERRDMRVLAFIAALYGLVLSTHPNFALYTPIVGLFILAHLWRDGWKRTAGGAVVAIGAGLVGCLPWLAYSAYYLMHDPPEDIATGSLPTRLVVLLTAAKGRGDWHVYATLAYWKGQVVRLILHTLRTLSEFSVAGVVALWRRHRAGALLVAGFYLVQAAFATTMRNWHHFDVYRLATYGYLGLFAGVGLAAVWQRVSKGWMRGVVCAVLVALTLGPPYAVMVAAPPSSRLGEGKLRHFRPLVPFRPHFGRSGEAACADALVTAGTGSTLWCTWGPSTTLQFLQEVEGHDKGVEVIVTGEDDDKMAALIARRLASSKQFFLLRDNQVRRFKWVYDTFQVEELFKAHGHTLVHLVSARRPTDAGTTPTTP